jgi:xylan 1,4-beta-xylosidase
LKTDVSALASVDKNQTTVLLWNYHDDDIQDAGSPVELQLKGIPAKQALMTHYRIDQEHSNSYQVWKKMGSPLKPTPEQIATLEKAGQLEQLSKPETVKITNGEALIKMQLPRQGVSLIKLTY